MSSSERRGKRAERREKREERREKREERDKHDQDERVEGRNGSVPEWRGGRDPDDSVVLVPFIPPVVGSAGVGSRRIRPTESEPPWPGSLPGPFPAAVHADPLPVEVLDAAGRSVVVDGRGALSASPHRLRIKGGMDLGEVLDITAWAGPWPVDERWWDSQRHRRRARLQVVVGDGTAHLVVLSSGRWSIVATYD